jgi:hypothetical protein
LGGWSGKHSFLGKILILAQLEEQLLFTARRIDVVQQGTWVCNPGQGYLCQCISVTDMLQKLVARHSMNNN